MALPRMIHGFAQNRFLPNEASVEFQALSLIADSFEHPHRSLLSVFVRQAVDKESAARFLMTNSCNGDCLATQEFLTAWISLLEQLQPITCDNLEDSVKQRVQQRNGAGQADQVHKEGLVFAYILSPSIFYRSSAGIKDGRLREMLAAFVGEERLQVLSSILDGSWEERNEDSSAQYLLLTKQAFNDFRHGRNSYKPQTPINDVTTEYFVGSNVFVSSTALANVGHVNFTNNADESALLQMETLLDVHRRLAQGFAWMEVAERMKRSANLSRGLSASKRENAVRHMIRRVSSCMPSFLKPLAATCQLLWAAVPISLRASTYKWLSENSLRFFDSTGSDRTVRLPFGLYLRVAEAEWAQRHEAEFKALQLVQKWTQIPAPRAVDTFQYAGHSFLLMTGVPGNMIGPSFYQMTDEQVDAAVQDLQRYIAELRQIPNQTGSNALICNALGAGILDWRLGESRRRDLKFSTETEFNAFLTYDLPLDKKAREKVQKSHGVKHDIVFTHADLNPRNILVDQNYKISGIVDWECAGWYPEYWECSKAHFGVRFNQRWIMDLLNPLFPNYNNEVEVEDMFAAMVPPW